MQTLIDDLNQRGMITRKDKRYLLPGRGNIPFADAPALRILVGDIEHAIIPTNVQTGADSAKVLAKKAMVQRSQDFAASSKVQVEDDITTFCGPFKGILLTNISLVKGYPVLQRFQIRTVPAGQIIYNRDLAFSCHQCLDQV